MRVPLLLGLLLSSTVPALALAPETEAYLKKIGLDPASDAVKIADQDGVIKTVYHDDTQEFSLASLAQAAKPNGVKAFVTTRAFIKSLKADFNAASFPKVGYDAMYLTPDERKLAGRKLIASIGQ